MSNQLQGEGYKVEKCKLLLFFLKRCKVGQSLYISATGRGRGGISTLLFQILIDRGMKDEERMKFFRGFILWQQEGLDMEKYPCLFINFGVNTGSSLEGPFQRRRVIMILRAISWNFRDF